MTISTTTPPVRGLSALQRRIMAAIANHTVNIVDERHYGTGVRKAGATYATVRKESLEPDGVGYGGGAGYRTAKRVTFSRAVHSLIRRKLVDGLALGWCLVPSMELLQWQGGGRLPNKLETSIPKIRLLALTAEGWQAAATIKPAVVQTPEATAAET